MSFRFRDRRSDPVGSNDHPGITDEADLVSRCKARDQKALEELFHCYFPTVSRLAIRYLRDKELAEDAVQDIFAKVFENIGGFKGRSRLSTWIYRVAANHCRDVLRKLKGEALHTGLSERFLADLAYLQGRQAAHREFHGSHTRLEVWDALNRLSERQRMIVTLHFFSEFSCPEIAGELGISEQAVRKHLRSAMDRLGRILNIAPEK